MAFSIKQVEEMFRRPQGKIVNVFHDPAKPERSLLEPGFNAQRFLRGMLGLVIFNLLFLGAIGGFLWLRWRVKRAKLDGELYVVFSRKQKLKKGKPPFNLEPLA